MANLVQGLLEQIDRVSELRDVYLRLPGQAGALAAKLMELKIAEGKEALGRGDTIRMMRAYQDLEQFEE